MSDERDGNKTQAVCSPPLKSRQAREEITDDAEGRPLRDRPHITRRNLDIIEFLPDATFVIDREGKVIAWNRAIEEMTGVRKKEILGRGDFAYAVPFYGERRPIVIDLVMGADSKFERKYQYVKKQGETYFAEAYAPNAYRGKGAYLWGKASPLYDGKGNWVGAIQSIRDVTDKRLADQALARSERQFRMLVETMNEGLCVRDENDRVLYANDKMCRLLGYVREELLGMQVSALFDSANLLIFQREMEKRRNREGSLYEIQMQSRDGRNIPVLVSGRPIFGEQGDYRGTISTMTDITTIKEAETKLRESEQKYRMIFENSPLGIFHFDADCVITTANENIFRIWGTTAEKLVGFNLNTSLKNKKMKAAVIACMSGKSAYYEGSYLSVTGGKISNLKANYGPILSADGKVIGGIGIIEDISERKQTEAALQESERQLHILSSQLLAAQEQERKRIARELHDGIGSSLSTIKFSLEATLRRMRQGSQSYESLQNVIVLTQHAIDESRRIMTDLRPPILDDFGILTTMDWFCAQFRKAYKHLRVDKEIEVVEEDIPEALKIVIFRVLQEALHNTAKYSQASRVKIGLRKTPGTLELKIGDNGIGFDRTSASRHSDSSSGLGLPSMKERTELSGGTFSIESTEGAGTKLCATWPL